MAEQPLDWVNTSIAAIGVISGAVGFFRAQAAAKRAGKAEAAAVDAQTDAAAALKKNSKNTKRIALALEAMNRTSPEAEGIQHRGGPNATVDEAGALKEAGEARKNWAIALQELSAPAGVVWTIEKRDGVPDTYRLRNDGDSDAKVVHVEGSPETVSNLASIRGTSGSTVDEVLAGSSVVVGVSNRLTLTVREIKVSWSEGDNDMAQSMVLELPD